MLRSSQVVALASCADTSSTAAAARLSGAESDSETDKAGSDHHVVHVHAHGSALGFIIMFIVD